MAGKSPYSDKVVVIVDDNPRFVTLVRTILRAFGVGTILGHTRPEAAFATMNNRHVDAAIIDLLMPEVDGLTLTRRIRASDRVVNAVMPIVLATGQADLGTVRTAIRHGVDEVLVKPFSPRTLHLRMSALFEHPRTYIRTPAGYFGPDRRKRRDGDPASTGVAWLADAEEVTREHLIERRQVARNKYGRLPPSPLEPREPRPVLVGPVTTIPVVAGGADGVATVHVPTPLRREIAAKAAKAKPPRPHAAHDSNLWRDEEATRLWREEEERRLWREAEPTDDVHLLD